MKILSSEINLDSPTVVIFATVVRIYNGDSDNILVTRKATGGSVIGTFLVPAGKVVYCEKDSTDTLEANANVKASKTAYSSMMSFVGQTADPGPSYTFSLSATSLDEGGSFTTTVTTTNVADGTNLYWELSGSGITSDDFSSGALTGTGTISNNTFNFSHTIKEDETTEGTEYVSIKLYDDSNRTNQVGNTVTVTINDSSVLTNLAGEWSSAFTGNNYLLVPTTTELDGNTWTYECWIYPTQLGNAATDQWHAFLSRWKAGDYSFILEANRDSKNLLYAYGDGTNYSGQIQASNVFQNDQWYHVALTRSSGGTSKVYVNGQEKISVSTPTISNTTLPVCIGSQADGLTAYNFVGYIHDVRLVNTNNGSLPYNNNFTPPTTPLGNITNTKLLACKDSVVTSTVVNVMEDNGAGSISNNGNVSSVSADPYTFRFFFSGDDYLGIGSNTYESAWDIMGGNFTLEAWIFRTSNPSYAGIIGQWENNGANANNAWVFETVQSGSKSHMHFYYRSGGSIYNAVGPTLLEEDQWHHVAVTKSGSTINVWVDGVKGADHTVVDTPAVVNRIMHIGGNVAGGGGWEGYIIDLKLTKGQALYTGTFTPITELTLTSNGSSANNVQLLMLDKTVATAATKTPANIVNLGGTIDGPYRGGP